MENKKTVIIGGGAAGLMAAGTAGGLGAEVTLLEKNPKCARKVCITGKGRCNITNDCPPEEFISNVVSNSKFLYSAAKEFTPAHTIEFFNSRGVSTVTERGRRVFPESGRAFDVADALLHYAQGGAKIINDAAVTGIVLENGSVSKVIAKVKGRETEYPAQAVIVCTGGLSYPLTGSTGDGYSFAASAGHTVTPLIPSLVPIEANDPICGELMGLSLKNTALKIVHKPTGKVVYEDFGEMLFTHFGLSGPMILSASAHLRKVKISECCALLDLKSALDEKTLDTRLRCDFEKNINKDFINSLDGLLPQKLIAPFARRTGIDSREKVNSITKEQRRTIIKNLKAFSIDLKGFRPLEEAIVTAGGVDTREINPKTMESKLVKGLFFAGEVLDLDCYTGGYNLQTAFCTGYVAGKNAAL